MEITVCQIITACKADFIINDEQLTMIAEVHKVAKEGDRRIEDLAVDPFFPHGAGEMIAEHGKAAQIVVDHADRNAFVGFSDQNVFQFGDAFTVFHSQIFQKDKMPGAFGRFDLILQGLHRVFIISDRTVVIERVAAPALYIMGILSRIRIFPV